MSYLSEISWTDRAFSCVATRIRSAYSSVNRREISFSRIAFARFFGDIKCLATRLSGLRLNLHDGGEHRLRDPLRIGERQVVELRVRFLAIQHDGTVQVLDPNVLGRHARELLARRCEGRREADEQIALPADGRDMPGELLEDPASVDRLQRVERQEGEER